MDKRYAMVTTGCVAHAIVVTCILLFTRPGARDFFYWGYWFLILVWPVWSVLLWKYRRGNIFSVVVPMIAGLIILSPVLAYVYVVIVLVFHQGLF
jgi:hypothetical protein